MRLLTGFNGTGQENDAAEGVVVVQGLDWCEGQGGTVRNMK